jgi:carboxylesterase
MYILPMRRPFPILAAAVAALGALVWRTRHLRAVERRCMERRTMGADGIVVGGAGFELEREGAPAVLLIHGGGDTPQTLRYLATHLNDRGFAVSAPLLPGHGRTLREFARVTAKDLSGETRQHYESLRARHEWVGVIGVSMGAALAVQLAAEEPTLPALGLVAPYLAMPPHIARAARLARLWGPLIPLFDSSDGISILDPVEQAQNLAYGAFSATALAALYAIVQQARAALPRVSAPTLMIQSRTDNRISVEAAERAFALLGAPEKRLVWVTGAAHIITVDYGREQVISQLGDWMTAHLGARSL